MCRCRTEARRVSSSRPIQSRTRSGRNDDLNLESDSTRRASPFLLAGLSVALVFLDWALFVRPSLSFVAVAPNDFLMHADLAHRLGVGQTPYVDFHTPYGWLAMWLLRAGLMLQGGFAGAPEAADMLMLAALLLLACVVLAKRVPTGAAIVLLAAIFGMTAAPWWMGTLGSVDAGLHHNHWGWSLLTILLLIGLPGRGRRRWLADGATVGALLSLMFFVNATHWAVGMAFVLLFGVALGEFRRAASLGMALFAICVLSVQAVGGWVDDYIRDLLAIVDMSLAPALEGGHRRLSVGQVLSGARADVALVVLLATAAALQRRLSRRLALHGLFALAACVAVMLQYSHTPNLMAALAAFLIRFAVQSPAGSALRRLSWFTLSLHLAPAFVKQSAAIAAFIAAVASGGTTHGQWLPASLPRMDGVWFGQLVFRSVNGLARRAQWVNVDEAFVWGRGHPGRSHGNYPSSAEYRASLRSGLELLRAVGTGQERVATLDYNNPFPFLLNAPPPKGVLIGLHINRHLGLSNAGDHTLTLGDAEWLMVPRLPYMWDTTELLLASLEAHLDERWTQAASNDLWTLLHRREQP